MAQNFDGPASSRLTPAEKLLRAASEKDPNMHFLGIAIAAENALASNAGVDAFRPLPLTIKAKTTTKTV